jgi:putative ABC transport system permease protein
MKPLSFAAPALIAIGTALSAALYCVVDGVLFKPLPGLNSEELYVFGRPPAPGTDSVRTVTVHEFLEIREASAGQAYAFTPGLAPDRAAPEPFRAVQVSPEFTQVAGVTPVAGRPLRRDDADVRVGIPALISESLWRARFGGTHRVFEDPITLNGIELRVVGVLPARFDQPSGANLWVPLRLRTDAKAASFSYLTCVVRLTGRTRALLDSSFASLELQPLRARLPVTAAGSSGLLLAVAIAAILTGWWTVVVTQAARWSTALRHCAIRVAMGASPIGASLSEVRGSLYVFAISQALAVMLAPGALNAVLAALPVEQTVGQPIWIDTRTLTFLGVMSCITAMFLVVMPLLAVRRRVAANPNGCLDVTVHEAAAGGRHMTPALAAIIAGNVVAWTLVLTVLRAHAAAAWFDPGIAKDDLLRITIAGPNNDVPGEALHRKVLETLGGQSWVRAVSGGELPIDQGGLLSTVSAVAPADPQAMGRPIVERWITDGYFESVGLAIVEGSDPFGHDRDARAVVVSRALALSTGLQVGGRVHLGGLPYTLVGIANDTFSHGRDTDPDPNVYLVAPRAGSSWVVRTHGRSLTHDAVARRTVLPLLGPYQQLEVAHASEMVARVVAPFAGTTRLLVAVAVMSLLLGAIGVAASLRDSCARRRRELAIRALLGADSRVLRRELLRPVLTSVAAGGILGLIGVAVSRAVLESLWVLPRLSLSAAVGAFVVVALVAVAVVHAFDPARAIAVTEVSRP